MKLKDKHSKQLKPIASHVLGASMLFLLLNAPTAWAQSTEEVQQEQVYELEDFIVTGEYLFTDQVNALKTPTPIIDVPQSLTITTAEEISLRGFKGISDIIAYTPGVNMSQGEGHRDAVVFRGVRSTADFYVDGVRDDVQYYRPLYNVEQVEILRGPNALLFGRGGAGGILNRVTKKGVIGERFNSYSMSMDTFGAAEIQLDSNVAINDNAAFRINAFYESIETDRDFSDGDRYGVNPTLTYKLTEKTTLDVSYEYIDHERFIDRGIPTGADGKPVDTFDDIVFGDQDLNQSRLEAHVMRALLQHRFTDTLKGNFSASYGNYDKFYQNFYASDYDEELTPDRVELDGYVDTTDRQNTVLSANLIGEFKTGDIEHALLFGAEYIDTKSDQDRFNPEWTTSPNDKEAFTVQRPLNLSSGTGVNADGDPTSVTFTAPNDNTSTNLQVYSLYIQDEIKPFEQLRIVLGARFDRFDIDVSDNLNSNNNGSQKDEEFTPRAGIIYKPQEALSLYTSYSKTFLPQSGEQYDNLGNDGLDPDEFTNLEAGLKWDFTKDLSLTAAIFEIQQDLVQDDGMGGSETLDTEINGFEIQLAGYITNNWFISTGYSYLDGELDDGNTPRELPEHLFSIWNSYQVTEQISVGLGAIYQGESYINNSNTARLPDFVRVDAAAYYQITENLRFQVNIENLLDEEYYPDAHSTHQATVGAPINLRLAITGQF